MLDGSIMTLLLFWWFPERRRNMSISRRHSIVTLYVMVEHPDPSFPLPHIRTA
jgi:hypothetical protein